MVGADDGCGGGGVSRGSSVHIELSNETGEKGSVDGGAWVLGGEVENIRD